MLLIKAASRAAIQSIMNLGISQEESWMERTPNLQDTFAGLRDLTFANLVSSHSGRLRLEVQMHTGSKVPKDPEREV